MTICLAEWIGRTLVARYSDTVMVKPWISSAGCGLSLQTCFEQLARTLITLGQNGATFTLTGNVGSPPNTIFSQSVAGAFFKSGLILQFPTVQATIRALTQHGKLRSTNSPVTYTRTGEPVQIRSTTNQTIFLQTASTANVQATTTPYTFTTGLTIDVVPRILSGGIIDMKINPALSTQAGTSAAQPGTTTPCQS